MLMLMLLLEKRWRGAGQQDFRQLSPLNDRLMLEKEAIAWRRSQAERADVMDAKAALI